MPHNYNKKKEKNSEQKESGKIGVILMKVFFDKISA